MWTTSRNQATQRNQQDLEGMILKILRARITWTWISPVKFKTTFRPWISTLTQFKEEWTNNLAFNTFSPCLERKERIRRHSSICALTLAFTFYFQCTRMRKETFIMKSRQLSFSASSSISECISQLIREVIRCSVCKCTWQWTSSFKTQNTYSALQKTRT